MADLVNIQRTVLGKLRCSYCTHYLSCGPIRCNSEGEAICGRCMPNEEDEEEIVVRNLSYEAAMEYTRFPCIYDQYGCKVMLLFNKVTVHESNCPFKPILCASLNECNWRGPTCSIFDHFSSEHQDLFLTENVCKIGVKTDTSQNLMIKEDDVVVLIQFSYTSTDQILHIDGVHFSDQNIELLCKVFLINGNDPDYLVALKPFKCGLYTSSKIDLKKAQKILFSTILPALQNPDIVLIKITLNMDKKYCLPACIDEMSLEKLKCSECYIYMVPPIATKNDMNYCSTCCDSASFNKELEMYAKKAQYPCCWNKCQFVGTYENIRPHEKDCPFASIMCLFSTDCLPTKNTAVAHLENKHSCKWFQDKITLFYYPTVSEEIYYCLVGEQVVILYLKQTKDSYSRITGTYINLYALFSSKNSKFDVAYHFKHLHCKLTSKTTVCVKQDLSQNNSIQIQVPKLPKCFGDKNYSIEIKITEPRVE